MTTPTPFPPVPGGPDPHRPVRVVSGCGRHRADGRGDTANQT